MNHAEPMTETPKKRENKMTGFNIRMLDDKTFLMRTSNKNYEYEKEYSYDSMDDLHKGVAMMVMEMTGKKMEKMDGLEREKE